MRQHPEILAWRILLAAFFTFLLICGSLVYIVQWYLFQSTVPLKIELTAARGTVIAVQPGTQQELAVSGQQGDLSAGVNVRTDANAQALLTFFDPEDGAPIASVVVLRDSQIEIDQASAPRFRLNKEPFRIQIISPYGRSEIIIQEGTRREVSFVLTAPKVQVQTAESGHYVIDISEQNTRVTTLSGQSQVTERDEGHVARLRSGQYTIIGRNDTGRPEIKVTEALLENGNFDRNDVGWKFLSDGEPAGQVFYAWIAGRHGVVLDRSQSNWPGVELSHGETRLFQDLNLEVSDYGYLELRGTFYIEEQSLSTCGIQGSECPLMLRIDYLDVLGTPRTYIHGFYASHDPALNYPLACASCRTEHERINQQTWYTFKSGNLFTVLPSEQQPLVIQQVSFYASGHAYKVYVTELELVGAPE